MINQSSLPNYTPQLQNLMQKVSIYNYKELSQKAGVSELQLIRLRRGLTLQMQVDILLKISQALEITVTELLANFAPESVEKLEATTSSTLQQEYQLLQTKLEEQKQSLIQEFQQSSLQILESWLVQWPTVVEKVKQNPRLAAVKILPLLRPVERLMQEWKIEAIAPVGTEVPFDPHLHQLMEGSAQEGDLVQVRYTGYRQGDKLLYTAKVSPTS